MINITGYECIAFISIQIIQIVNIIHRNYHRTLVNIVYLWEILQTTYKYHLCWKCVICLFLQNKHTSGSSIIGENWEQIEQILKHENAPFYLYITWVWTINAIWTIISIKTKPKRTIVFSSWSKMFENDRICSEIKNTFQNKHHHRV